MPRMIGRPEPIVSLHHKVQTPLRRLSVISARLANVATYLQSRHGSQVLAKPSQVHASWPCLSGLWPYQPSGRILVREAGTFERRLRPSPTIPRSRISVLCLSSMVLAGGLYPEGAQGKLRQVNQISDLAKSGTADLPTWSLCFLARMSHRQRSTPV
jgi:hypothetical protein